MRFMQLLFMGWVLLFSGFVHAITQEVGPLLVVVIMVKNEATVIQPTLQPYIDAGIDAFLVFDTGSTDETMAKAQELFDEYNVANGVIIQEPFIDFATSRNRAIELVEQEFPNAVFMLMPDAEWYMKNAEGLVKFCQEHENDTLGSYLVRIVSTDLDFYTQRLVRCRSGLCFAGVVHETIIIGTREKVPADVYFELRPEGIGIEKTRKRWLRDKDLLLREFKNNPFSPRNTFYLAQTYECLGEFEEAYRYYKLRSQLPGWDEENFQTFYRLGRVAEEIKLVNGECDWPIALGHYLEAFTMRPWRVEPIIKIAHHYLMKGNHALAYLFAHRACEMPYPEQDVLFVEKDMYDYARFDILGQCAWYIQEYEAGEKAILGALQAHPEYTHLMRNLQFYLNRKFVAEAAIA